MRAKELRISYGWQNDQRLQHCKPLILWRARRDSNPPTTWFEVTPTDLHFQLEQSLATLAAFANPT